MPGVDGSRLVVKENTAEKEKDHCDLSIDAPKFNYFTQRIAGFDPAWFSTVMGVGICGNLLREFPYQARWINGLSYAFWGVATVDFIMLIASLFSMMYLYPRRLLKLCHNERAVFWGCLPMGLATVTTFIIINWGDRAWVAAYAIYWIDTILSYVSALLVMYIYIHFGSERKMNTLTPALLLPTVALVVVSSLGGAIVPHMPQHLRGTVLIMSFIAWGAGQVTALMIIGAFIIRWYLHGKLPKASRLSMFIACGPCGQGSFSIQINALNLAQYLQDRVYPALSIDDSASIASKIVIEYIGYALGMTFFALGLSFLFWSTLAVASGHPKTFSLSWWGLTFPLGTMALASTHLSVQLDSTAWKILSCIFIVCVIFITTTLTVITVFFGYFKSQLHQVPTADLPLLQRRRSN
ncbi:hypothetical protein CANCADRAFT_70231 [Tortispora caseinolytica NRRL Y-17796]|uniref:C4-dicarboxylate transporter/malic acid transport protein n=1 Tax=Tortispora caseinolytica NRRL Y-17796 TaxID=767744 RepID=A0A1E4TCF2_9ASCO|nr:hypothetical protein CANCADRAFT_70231 [Tortispora caseinolytica NRRL Y-17796]